MYKCFCNSLGEPFTKQFVKYAYTWWGLKQGCSLFIISIIFSFFTRQLSLLQSSSNQGHTLWDIGSFSVDKGTVIWYFSSFDWLNPGMYINLKLNSRKRRGIFHMNRVIWSESEVQLFRQLSRIFVRKILTRKCVAHIWN